MILIIKNVVFIMFPILMYLVICCCNLLDNKEKKEIVFILTMISSLYLGLMLGTIDNSWFLFGNIPILICYLNRKGYLGIILSLSVEFISLGYDVNSYFLLVRFLCYLIIYIVLRKKKNFMDRYFMSIELVQAFLITLEYFKVIDMNLILVILISYLITFYCLYLLNLANKVIDMNMIFKNIEKDKVIKDSLFKLTHEIKNPLAVCKGYISMMDLHDYDKSVRYVGIIKSELDRSLGIMSDFVEYSKIKINKDIFDMSLLMEEVYESFKILGNNKNVVFKYDGMEKEIFINGDFERIKQVLVNVIKNSMEAITGEGVIELKIRGYKDKVIIKIIDNGVGMTEEELANMKEMFYTTKENGTGLGVSLSNEIIEAHKGKMSYVSKKGEGTTCIITLPI